MITVRCYVRTADKTKKAEIGISPEVTVADVIETCLSKWKLPTDVTYTLVDFNKNQILPPNEYLTNLGIQEGTILELHPVLEAGSYESYS